jgi:hypothetical protein
MAFPNATNTMTPPQHSTLSGLAAAPVEVIECDGCDLAAVLSEIEHQGGYALAMERVPRSPGSYRLKVFHPPQRRGINTTTP